MTVFLQASDFPSSDYLAIGIAVATAIGLIVGLGFNAKRLSQETSTRNLQIVRDFFLDFIEQDRLEPKIKSKTDCVTYVTGYLDLLDAIAFLNLKRKISPQLIQVFHGHFSYGIRLLDWYKDIAELDATNNFKNLAKWLKKNTKYNENKDNENKKCEENPLVEKSKDELNSRLLGYKNLKKFED